MSESQIVEHLCWKLSPYPSHYLIWIGCQVMYLPDVTGRGHRDNYYMTVRDNMGYSEFVELPREVVEYFYEQLGEGDAGEVYGKGYQFDAKVQRVDYLLDWCSRYERRVILDEIIAEL